MRQPVDVLLVSPGTTPGWRRADAEFTLALESLGGQVATCTSDYRIARHFRRTQLLTDLAEAAAMRRTLTKALRRYEPRAIVYSSPQAAMLQSRGRLKGARAVRFDVLARVNRQGAGTGILHALERRALRAVRLLLPTGLDPRNPPAFGTPEVPLPIPVEMEPGGIERDAIAVAYAGNPEKKGLDLVLRAWQVAGPAEWRLVVTGIAPDAARRFLRRHGIAEPPGIEWAGIVDRDSYIDLIQRAAVFMAASRYEDYGIAQLEALATGALLVTVASPGPYEALGPARELDARLVADDGSSEDLARALAAAISLDDGAREAYQEKARRLLRPYSRESLVERLREQVLPVLLGD